jgi:hypothetical protein
VVEISSKQTVPHQLWATRNAFDHEDEKMSYANLVKAVAASQVVPEASEVSRLLKSLAATTIPTEPLHDLDDQTLCVAALEYFSLVVRARKLLLPDEFVASEGIEVVERWSSDYRAT